MAITYTVNFGLPNDNIVQYDSESHLLKTVLTVEDEIADKTCVLYAPASGLKLFTNIADGEIFGLEASIDDIENIPKSDVLEFFSTDGSVKAEWDCGKLLADCNYLIEFAWLPTYDGNKGFIGYGNFSNDCIAVRICKNLFLCLDTEGKLCGVTIKL